MLRINGILSGMNVSPQILRILLGTLQDCSFGLKTNNQWRMYFTNDGNVGIGTISPTHLLHVNGIARINTLNINNQYVFPTTDGLTGQVLKTNGSGVLTWQPDNNQLYDAGNGLQLVGNTFSFLSPVSITNGGTNATSFTNNKFLWYNGTSIVSSNYDQASFALQSHSHENHIAGNGITGADYNGSDQIVWNVNFGTESGQVAEGNHTHTGSVFGNGTLNYLPKWSPSGTTLGNSQFYDNGENVGLNITTPKSKFHVHDNRIFRPIIDVSEEKSEESYAYSAIQLTNNTTKSEVNDGLILYTKDNDGGITLQEKGNLQLQAGSSLMTMHPDKKISLFNNGLTDASLNIFSLNNNGLHIRMIESATSLVEYAFSIQSNKNTSDLMRCIISNKIVYKLNGKGEANFGNGVEKISIGNTNGLGTKYATGYIGFNITKNGNNWVSNSDGANNGAVLLYSNVNGALMFANIPSSGNTNNPISDDFIKTRTSLIITNEGRVGIGTENPGWQYKLAVEGTIGARRVKVTQVDFGADFVFSPTYNLTPLNQVEAFVKTNRHLPDIPSEAQMQTNGIDLTEMNIQLLQKVEELYLHIIEMDKRIKELESNNSKN